mmetsp:Transcript_15730/g.49234  ORF Transcript_15730/g.49234 Transcript_15730/m.49234 type:complete len:234 (-) Transcript_15730:197-898(-)
MGDAAEGAAATEAAPPSKTLRTEEPLPAGWSAHLDPATGATYYWNASVGATSWEKPTGETAAAATEVEEPSMSEVYSKTILGASGTSSTSRGSASTWVKHTDPESGVPYFCNTTTNETQWEVPPEGFIDATVFAPTISKPDDASSAYAATASFSAQSGQFTAADGSSYWDSIGRPNDREGRMMSHYFDLSTLEKNRQEAEEKKKKLKKYDWRKYKEIKKKERTKRRVQALLKD